MADYLIFAAWATFFLYLGTTSDGVKATTERQRLAAQLVHYVPLGAAAVLLLVPFPQLHLAHRWLADTRGTAALGAMLAILGVAVTVWSRRALGGNWSLAVTLKQDHELVQRGPYRWVRNPIYAGLLLLMVGTAIRSGMLQGLLALILALAALGIKLRQEERFLLRRFPETYPMYRRRVKALVPFLF